VRCPESLEPEFQAKVVRKGDGCVKQSVGMRSFVGEGRLKNRF
jgi:hypothetical protein